MTPRQPLGMTPSGSGAQPGRQAALRGLLGRECRRRWWIFRRRAADVRGFIPTGWYPTGGARAGGRAAGGPERARAAIVSEPEGAESDPAGRAPSNEGVRAEEYVGQHADRHGVVRADSYRRAARSLYPDGAGELAVRRQQAGQRRYSARGADSIEAGRAVADRARHLHRQGESHLRSGAGRYERGQRRRVAGAVRRAASRPTCTSWRASSCCSTTSTSTPT